MMRSFPNRMQGFTMIELLIVFVVFIIMMLAIVQFFVAYTKTYSVDRAEVATASSASRVMSSLAEDTRVADAVVASHTFSGTTYTTGTNVLVLELPSVDSTGTVITTTSDYVAYYMQNGTYIYRLVDAASGSARASGQKELSDSASSLSFTYSNADPTLASKVTVDVLTQQINRGDTIQTHLTNAFSLRNYITP